MQRAFTLICFKSLPPSFSLNKPFVPVLWNTVSRLTSAHRSEKWTQTDCKSLLQGRMSRGNTPAPSTPVGMLPRGDYFIADSQQMIAGEAFHSFSNLLLEGLVIPKVTMNKDYSSLSTNWSLMQNSAQLTISSLHGGGFCFSGEVTTICGQTTHWSPVTFQKDDRLCLLLISCGFCPVRSLRKGRRCQNWNKKDNIGKCQSSLVSGEISKAWECWTDDSLGRVATRPVFDRWDTDLFYLVS